MNGNRFIWWLIGWLAERWGLPRLGWLTSNGGGNYFETRGPTLSEIIRGRSSLFGLTKGGQPATFRSSTHE